MGKSMAIGGGGRFEKLAGQRGAALAAYLGRKKYGKERFQEMAAAGKKRAEKNK